MTEENKMPRFMEEEMSRMIKKPQFQPEKEKKWMVILIILLLIFGAAYLIINNLNREKISNSAEINKSNTEDLEQKTKASPQDLDLSSLPAFPD
jgi:hypothetical protein